MATKQKKADSTALGAKSKSGSSAVALDRSPSKIRALGQYFEDAKVELGKVSWPTKKEVRITSIAVLVLVVVMSIFLGIVDILLSKIVEALLSTGM